jgi:outer membrane biosynthesis protein TonB
VKSTWRSAPRAIVSADAIERRESINEAESIAAENLNAWANPSIPSWGAGEDVPEDEAEPAGNDAPEPSNDGWGNSVPSFDPWLVPEQPKPQQRPPPQQRPKVQTQQRTQSQWKPQPQPQSQSQSQWRPQQKPQFQQRPPPQQKFQPQQKTQPNTNNAWANKKPSSSWADQVDAHSAAGYPDDDDGFSSVGSKRGGRAKAPKSSTSGWGTVDEKPW